MLLVIHLPKNGRRLCDRSDIIIILLSFSFLEGKKKEKVWNRWSPWIRNTQLIDGMWNPIIWGFHGTTSILILFFYYYWNIYYHYNYFVVLKWNFGDEDRGSLHASIGSIWACPTKGSKQVERNRMSKSRANFIRFYIIFLILLYQVLSLYWLWQLNVA